MKAKVLTGVLGVLVVVGVLFVAVEKGYVCTTPGVHVVAILRAIPTDVMVGEPVQLDGRDSYVERIGPVPREPITKYEWDFTNNGSYDYEEEKDVSEDGDGDGIFGSTTHIYTEAGDYTAKLRATSASAGDNDIAYATVHVHGYPADLHVDDDSEAVSPDGSSWATAYKYLQDALAVAQYGGKILVAKGTYYPDRSSANPTGSGDQAATFQLLEEVAVEGGYAGLWGDPDERDIRKYKTILSGDIDQDDEGGVPDEENSYKVVMVIGADNAVLDGFTITGGNGTYGSGIYCASRSPTISNCVIIGNKGSRYGGGMYIDSNSHGLITLINCFFIDNESYGYGGGVRVSYRDNKVSLTNCVFIGNKVTSSSRGSGGGVHSIGEVTLTNCTFYGNDASEEGGGVYNEGDMTIVNSIFRGNTAAESGTVELKQIDGRNVPEVTYSCIEGLVSGGVFDSGDNVENIGDDPSFGDADNPAGLDGIWGTWDDGLQLSSSSSPCIDSGLNSAVEVATDIIGNERIIEGDGDEEEKVDMGAYEYAYFPDPWPSYEVVECGVYVPCCDGELWPEGEQPKFIKVVFEGRDLGACDLSWCDDHDCAAEDIYSYEWILRNGCDGDWKVAGCAGAGIRYWQMALYPSGGNGILTWWVEYEKTGGGCYGDWVDVRFFRKDDNDPEVDHCTTVLGNENNCTCEDYCYSYDCYGGDDETYTATYSWGPGIGAYEYIKQWPEWVQGTSYVTNAVVWYQEGSSLGLYRLDSGPYTSQIPPLYDYGYGNHWILVEELTN